MPDVIYKEVPVVELAPDALVFINGNDTIKDEEKNAYEIRNDITSITTSLNIDSVPGSASFTVSLPDHSIRRYGNKTYRAIEIMSEIEIYMKGRFEIKRKGGTFEYPYYPVFWGMIVSISEAYADGINTLSFTCSDILYWWKIVRTGTNVAIVATQEQASKARKQMEVDSADKKPFNQYTDPALQTSLYGNRYADYTIPSTLFAIAQTTTLDFTPLEIGMDHTTGTSTKNKLSTEFDEMQQQGKAFETKIRSTIIDYWRKRFDEIARNLRLFGFKGTVTTNAAGFKDYTFNFDEESWAEIRTGTLNAGGPELMETVTKSKLEIANELRDMIQFEFYMDVNGEIIFKPPFYNINIKDSLISRIDDVDIINFNFTQSESEVVTRVDVTAQISKVANIALDKYVRRGIAIDQFLAQRYGLRIQERKCPWLKTSEDCLQFAKSELDRINSKAKSGTLTIVGRPELRLGYPIYIVSRDSFYYVKSIEHSFDFGGQFTTNIGIINERTKMVDSKGNPIKNRLFRPVGKLVDDFNLIEGGTSINKDEYDNYVKEMVIQRLCHPNKEPIKKLERSVANDGIEQKIKHEGIVEGELIESADVKSNDRAITDLEGYELIGLFKYGRNLKFENNILTIVSKDQEKTKANKAVGIDINNEDIYFSPSNSAHTSITLDNQRTSMLMIQSDDIDSYAYRAQNLTPNAEKEK